MGDVFGTIWLACQTNEIGGCLLWVSLLGCQTNEIGGCLLWVS